MIRRSPIRILPALATVCLLANAGCTTLRTSFDRDPSVPLSGADTWAWSMSERTDDARAENGPTSVSPIARQRIERAIESTLAEKGYRRADTAHADLLVDYSIGVTDRREFVREYEPGIGHYLPVVRCGPKGCWRSYLYEPIFPPTVTYRDIPYREGTLIVDFTDRTSGRVAARAVGSDRLRDRPRDEASVREAVEEMFEELPDAS